MHFEVFGDNEDPLEAPDIQSTMDVIIVTMSFSRNQLSLIQGTRLEQPLVPLLARIPYTGYGIIMSTISELLNTVSKFEKIHIFLSRSLSLTINFTKADSDSILHCSAGVLRLLSSQIHQ